MRDRESLTTIIYCFLCAKTGSPVYVGKTTMPLKVRVQNHLGSARRKPNSPFHKWLSKNLHSYRVIVLDAVCFKESSKAEIRWMTRLSARFPLYNARPFSFGNPGVGRVQWTEELLGMLGNRTDTEIAGIIGCNRQTVAYRRMIEGIPRLPDPHKTPQEIFLSPEIISRIGLEPDYKIAQSVGVSKFVIAKHRRRLGIKSYAETTGNNGKIKIGDTHRRWKS